MDLDELKEKWAEHDHKIETSLQLNRQLLNTITMDKAKSALRPLTLSLALEVAANFAAIVVLGKFIYDHLTLSRFAIPAVALDMYVIVINIFLIRQIAVANTIDYGRPIVTIQKHLGALRILRIRCTQWTLLTAPMAWPSLLIVGLKGLFGVDAYHMLGPGWLTANLLFGIVILALAFWLSKQFGDRLGRWPAFQRLSTVLAGSSLNAASAFLTTLSEFEGEKGDHR